MHLGHPSTDLFLGKNSTAGRFAINFMSGQAKDWLPDWLPGRLCMLMADRDGSGHDYLLLFSHVVEWSQCNTGIFSAFPKLNKGVGDICLPCSATSTLGALPTFGL